MMRLGITGGIGSGKSYVATLLEQLGVPVYRTDDEARRLMDATPAIRTALSTLTGQDMYLPTGTLDRKRLAAWLFADGSRVAAVNAVVHPVVRADFLQWVAQQTAPVVAMECAILFESGFHTLVDRVLVVSAPHELCLSRAMARDGATAEQVQARMRAQMDDAERQARADVVLHNDGKADLLPQLRGLLAGIG